MYDLLKKNSAFFIPYLIVLLFGVAWLSLWPKTNISLFINGHHDRLSDYFFEYWTDVGLGYLIIPVALTLAFIRFRFVLMAVMSFILSFCITDSLKYILRVPRPLTVFTEMHQDFYHVPGVDIFSSNSFPSGHATITFAIFCILALMSTGAVLRFLCFLIAFLVGYSRIYLGEHFLTDVIAGSVVGVSSAVFTYRMLTNWKALNKFAGIDKPLINFRSQ
jgi:membrane-associated phospholipid phosphatase